MKLLNTQRIPRDLLRNIRMERATIGEAEVVEQEAAIVVETEVDSDLRLPTRIEDLTTRRKATLLQKERSKRKAK